ncbi:MAG: sulfide/dihydroorotate dehydrogenase-like FAD/NAD-binding protein [Elusimicrobiota bacterium]
MNKILKNELIAPSTRLLEIEAPEISKKVLPGQFIILRINEKGERIPLTVVKSDNTSGTITIVFQEIGKTTRLLGTLNPGEQIRDVVGPLGRESEIKKYDGPVILVGGGLGAAELLPVCRALKNKGNYIISILGARSKELIIFENALKNSSDEFFVATDDGSYGQKGFVTDILKNIITAKQSIAIIYAVGPVPMMKAVSNLTKPTGIKTIVSLNPIMVDGTGMCGSCRCTIAGKTKFACVDGPEFDAREVDWAGLEKRLKLFKEQEIEALKTI